MNLDEELLLESCGSFGPGHMLHWKHWKQAAAAPCVNVSRVIQSGTSLELVIPGQPSLHWHHHAPARIREALRSVEAPIIASPSWKALRVDGYWFNCAADDSAFTLCG